MTAAERTLDFCDMREQKNRAEPIVVVDGPKIQKRIEAFFGPKVTHYALPTLLRALCGSPVLAFDRRDLKSGEAGNRRPPARLATCPQEARADARLLRAGWRRLGGLRAASRRPHLSQRGPIRGVRRDHARRRARAGT
jgi:hypothetical protein